MTGICKAYQMYSSPQLYSFSIARHLHGMLYLDRPPALLPLLLRAPSAVISRYIMLHPVLHVMQSNPSLRLLGVGFACCTSQELYTCS